MFLQCATQGSSAVRSVRTDPFDDPSLCIFGHLHLKLTANQSAVKLGNKQSDNLEQVGVGERLEHDYFIEAVDELRVESLLDCLHHSFFNRGLLRARRRLEPQVSALLNEARADVGGHYEYHVLEVDSVSQRVC